MENNRIRNIVRSSLYDAAGGSACYWRINSRTGIKTYPCKQTRDREYRLMCKFRKIAPRIHGRINIIGRTDGNDYGIVLEHVTPYYNYYKWYDTHDEWGWKCPIAGEKLPKGFDPLFERFNQVFNSAGYKNKDNHGGNYGIASCGRHVCLDYSHVCPLGTEDYR